MKKEKGITLIVLVITIIILLILAGITITFMLGENGLLKRTKNIGEGYLEKVARERLELALADLTVAKLTDTQYNEDEYIDDTLIEQTMLVEGNIVNVDGWQFEINRSVPKIVANLGKGDDVRINFTVNPPKLTGTGLVGVQIQEDGSLTEVGNKKDWYCYDGVNNEWANAKTKEGSLFVWIPRYAYKINEDQSIDIVFLRGTTNQYVEDGKIKEAEENGYIVHPAFQDGREYRYANGEWREEITGFWVAKFEAGYQDADKAMDSNIRLSTIYTWHGFAGFWAGNDINTYYGTREVGTKIKYPVFQANKPSMNYISISDAYDVCRTLTSEGNPYGLQNIDSHLMKNSEWGAIAYLTQSKYGRNKEEVMINNVSVNGEKTIYAITGYAGNTITAEVVTTTLANIQSGLQAGSWLTSQGITASSTKNRYGIYDLSGGLYEFTAGYIAHGEIYNTYGGSLKGDSTEYKNRYEGIADEVGNYNTSPNPSRKGEAIWETSTVGTENNAWNEDDSRFVYSPVPFMTRGSGLASKRAAGVFAFYREFGYCEDSVGFRPILISEKN